MRFGMFIYLYFAIQINIYIYTWNTHLILKGRSKVEGARPIYWFPMYSLLIDFMGVAPIYFSIFTMVCLHKYRKISGSSIIILYIPFYPHFVWPTSCFKYPVCSLSDRGWISTSALAALALKIPSILPLQFAVVFFSGVFGFPQVLNMSLTKTR